MKSFLSLIAWIGVFIVICVGLFSGFRVEQIVQRSIVVYFVLYAGALITAVVIGVGLLSGGRMKTGSKAADMDRD